MSLNGVLLLDKPEGLSSFAAVQRVRKILGVKKAGHAGTLDPFASGLLVVCLGEATKIAGFLTQDKKAYEGVGILGQSTDTYDRCGEASQSRSTAAVTQAQIESLMGEMSGKIEQTPPPFSAIKINGERAYKKARRGEEVTIEPRIVHIEHFGLRAWYSSRSSFEFEVICSKGTYVRSLIHDIGIRVECGAYLDALRRTSSGLFNIDGAANFDTLQDAPHNAPLISINEALHDWTPIDVDEPQAKRIRNGQPLKTDCSAERVKIRKDGDVLALGTTKLGEIWPTRVFNI